MPLGSASDIAFILRDAGEAVVYNGVTSYGVLEQMDAVEGSDSGGMVQVRVTTLLIQTGAFDELRVDGRILVNSLPYRIDRFGPEDDGELTRLYLARLS